MGAKCSFCSDNSRSGGGQTYPVPRSKHGKNQQNLIVKQSQGKNNKILIPPLKLSQQNIPQSYPHENQDQLNLHQLSLDFSQNEMLPIDVQDLNLVINSISEQRPTPRELTQLYERQIKLQNQNEYGVQGFKMHCIPKHDISTHLRSTQSSKQQQSSQKYSTPQKVCEKSKIEEQICQENGLRMQSDIKSKSSLSSQKVRYINEMDYSQNNKFNKVVIKIEKMKIYPNKKYKNLAIKIQIPQNVAPEYFNNMYVSRTFKPQECQYFSETFILLFKDKSDICDKKFIIGLVEIGKNRKITKEIGHKHTFMIEQLVEGKIHEKELLVCPENHKNNQMIKQSQILAYENDSSLDYSKTKQTLIAKINMKMQFIRNEEQTLQELIQGMNQKLEEVQEAIENVQILDQNNITSDQFYQQFFANDSQYSGNNLSQDISISKQQVGQDDCIYPTSLLKQLDQIANEREIQNSNQNLQSEMQYYENQDVGTTLPDTYEKQKQPTYMQYSNDNYDFPNKQEQYDVAAFGLDQQNDLKLQNQHIGYQNAKNKANRKYTQRISTAQKYNQRHNLNFIAMSEINLYSGMRDNNGHIRNSSSQEAGFYIAQHDLKGNKDYY